MQLLIKTNRNDFTNMEKFTIQLTKNAGLINTYRMSSNMELFSLEFGIENYILMPWGI